jgi:hypothetical protein
VAALVRGIPHHGRRGAGWITDTDPLITFTQTVPQGPGPGDGPSGGSPPPAVPLPPSLSLLAGALGGLCLFYRRRTRPKASPV